MTFLQWITEENLIQIWCCQMSQQCRKCICVGGTGHQSFSHFLRGHSLGKVTEVPQASSGIPSALTSSWCGELHPFQAGLGKACFKCLRLSGLTAECSPQQVHISPWVRGKSGPWLSPLCGLGWIASQLMTGMSCHQKGVFHKDFCYLCYLSSYPLKKYSPEL